MRLNTLEKLYLCLRDGYPEIVMDEETRLRALRPVQRMLEMSKNLTPVQQKEIDLFPSPCPADLPLTPLLQTSPLAPLLQGEGNRVARPPSLPSPRRRGGG